ncbi:hypothetical protein GCM10010967_27980 [Dyadobacter beijingensis]|uniref:VWFA domain-containing protein n=1 Tax=Dyadobacter beijingensis TaxID=365489 RepID=A0ABQ2HVZ4_9BACT|nr:hypothetical protein [Dyadobacter beijingensis]GGM93257.1 hypothetical protein GCM10010967_27980 [Dyadobacter beijingensis]
MGFSSWSSDAYDSVSRARKTRSIDDNFTQNKVGVIHPDLSPNNVDVRESRDSQAHPDSVPIIVALDVTGSMGSIPENLIKNKLGALMNTLINNGILDPQIMFMAIGDHISDDYPLQVGQFESGTMELDQCLSRILIEGGGGGQNRESYPLAWYFAARHTSIDSFEKRQEKGFLFTIGDEGFHDHMAADLLQAKCGYKGRENLNAASLLNEASRAYSVFHIHANEASYHNDHFVFSQWKTLLGERFLILEDQNNIAELIATTVALVKGVQADMAMSGFDAQTRLSVSRALVSVKDSLVRRDHGKSGIIAL